MKRKRLTKQEADSAERAAIAAGYSPKSARAIGCRLLRRPDIQARIADLQRKQAEDEIAAM